MSLWVLILQWNLLLLNPKQNRAPVLTKRLVIVFFLTRRLKRTQKAGSKDSNLTCYLWSLNPQSEGFHCEFILLYVFAESLFFVTIFPVTNVILLRVTWPVIGYCIQHSYIKIVHSQIIGYGKMTDVLPV